MDTKYKNLQFSNDGKFRIMAVGDIHEKDYVCGKTEDFLRLINAALDDIKPNLVILMGDLVQVYEPDENGVYSQDTVLAVKSQLDRIITPYLIREIPFAVVFGNHDGEWDGRKEMLLELLMEYPNFVIIDCAEVTGCGNTNLLIKSSDGTRNAFNIWLIDSGNCAEGGGYAFVMDDQIAWYEKKSDELRTENGGEPLPSVLFQHIPVPDIYRLLKETTILNPYRVRGHGSFSRKFYVLDKEKARGYMGEGPCSPDYNNGQFESWKKQKDVIAAFFGHDHQNDFVGELDGIILGYTKCSGFHIYGDGLQQGVREIILDERNPRVIETCMRRYRDYFGTDCNSIKGYNLLTDRWHTNFKATIAASGAIFGAVALGFGARYLIRRK
jgi:predicted phosphodiesterase